MRAPRSLVVAIMIAITTVTASPATAGQHSEPGDPGQPLLTVVDQTAFVPPDGEFVLQLDVADAPVGSRVEAILHDRVTGRIRFTETLEGGNLGPVISRACGTVLTSGVQQRTPCMFPVDEVPDGEAAVIGIGLRSSASGPADRLLLSEKGVYPLDVVLSSPDGTVIDRLVTHLVRLPGAEDIAAPLGVSLILPLTAPPGLQPDGATVLDPADDRRLNGRLDLLDEYADTDMMVQANPETMAALAVLEDTNGLLLTGTAARGVLIQAYVDLNATAWWAEDMGEALTGQYLAGTETLQASVGSPDTRSWLLTATDDGDTLTRLRASGVDRLVIPDEMLSPVDEEAWPIALDTLFEVETPEGARIPAVADDAGLRAHDGASGDPTLDALHVLSDLALLYFQRPGIERGVAFRISDTSPEPFVKTLLDGFEESTILEPRTLGDLFATAEVADAAGPDGESDQPLLRSITSLPPPALGAYPDQLNAARRRFATYKTVVGTGPATQEIEQLLLVSGSRVLTPDDQQSYLDAALDRMAVVESGVVTPKQPAVTLAAREGVIGVTIQNLLDQPVSVRVRLESEKLDFPDGNVIETILEPGDTRLEVDVRARATGAFPVEVSVWSPDESIEFDRSRFTLRSTAIPGAGLVLSGLAFAFLAGWWALHFRKTRRARGLVDSDHPAGRHQDQKARDQVIDDIASL